MDPSELKGKAIAVIAQNDVRNLSFSFFRGHGKLFRGDLVVANDTGNLVYVPNRCVSDTQLVTQEIRRLLESIFSDDLSNVEFVIPVRAEASGGEHGFTVFSPRQPDAGGSG